MNTPRYDAYAFIHKGLRAFMAHTLVRTGRLDVHDPADPRILLPHPFARRALHADHHLARRDDDEARVRSCSVHGAVRNHIGRTTAIVRPIEALPWRAQGSR